LVVPFSPRAFFLQVPSELLKSYFEGRGELLDFPWDRFSLSASDPLHDAWCELPEASRDQSETELRAVADLGTPEGLPHLLEQGRLQGVDLAGAFASCQGGWHKAFWAFLHCRRVFDAARQIHQVEQLHGRYWHQRRQMPSRAPDASPAARRDLGHALSAYYRPEDRGAYCDVHRYRRGEKDLFIAYPQDVVESVLGYEQGTLRARSHRSVFEVVFAYDAGAGTLDVHAHGGRAVHRDLQQIFSRVILGAELPPEGAPTPYCLDHLKTRGFHFPTDPEDAVREVKVKALRLNVLGFGRVNFDAGALRDRRDVYNLVDGYLDARGFPLSNVNVDDVRLQMVFDFAEGPRVLSFGVKPDSCTLRDAPEHLVAMKCLRLWEIARAG
jgi:hypothetical protein